MRSRLALLLFALAVMPSGPLALAEEYFAQEKCSLCHIRRSVFFDPGFAGADRLPEYNEERLCGSCHNGSVRDSRAVLWRGAQHPPPSGKDAGGGKRCSICHSPHAEGGWGVLAGTSVSLRKGGDEVCGGCHANHSSGTGIHRKGFPGGGCRECHQAHGGTGKHLLRDSREGVCLRCHMSVSADKSGGHPVSQCASCHPVHGKGTPAAFDASRCRGCHAFEKAGKDRKGRKHPAEDNCLECHSFHADAGDGGRRFRGRDADAGAVCGKCHAAYRAETAVEARRKGTHITSREGRKEGLCLKCHAVHDPAPHTALLVSDKPYFCLGCHEDKNTIREAGTIGLAHPVFEKVKKGRLEEAVREGIVRLGQAGELTCGTCHVVHGAAAETLLIKSGFGPGEICFRCHENMRGKRHKAASTAGLDPACRTCHPVHGVHNEGSDAWEKACSACHPREGIHRAGKTGGADGNPRDLPLFDGKGRKAPGGSVSCPTCHEPHGGAKRKKGLRRDYAFSAFLCTACHASKETVALTPHDFRGIVGASICEPCHIPHKPASPVDETVPDVRQSGADACLSCHRKKGMGSIVPKGGHPVGFMVTRPLPHEFPLFGPDGGKREKGSFSCSTCHEVHGMGILPTGRGTGKLLRGGCHSCHEGYEAGHGNTACVSCHPPHADVKSSGSCAACHPGNGKGVAKAHSSVGQGCGACHRIHDNGKAERSGNRCVSCHALKGGITGTPHAELGRNECMPCHPAHDSPVEQPHKYRSWENVFPPDLACLRCHKEKGPGKMPRWTEHPKREKKVPTSYGATVSLESAIYMSGRFLEGGRPLFPLFGDNGTVSLNGRLGCLTCHDPHAGATPTTREGKRTASGYLRDPSAVFISEICSACHRKDAAERVRRFHEFPRRTN